MRKINKGTEPQEWTEYKLTPDAVYKAIPELRESLFEEQGYICAYCMRRIPQKDKNSNETSRIDHVLSREQHPDLQLDYRNMVACCPGAIDHDFHCDKLKGKNDITFNLFDDTCISTLTYSSKDGHIQSSNSGYDNEMNQILNLNHSLLKKNRQQTLKGVVNRLPQRVWKKAEIKKLLQQWDNKNSEGKFYPYSGIVVWYLKKKLRTAIS